MHCGVFKFAFGDGLIADDVFIFVDRLAEGFLGLVGLHGREADEGALAARGNEARADAVGPVLVFAKIHIDARREVAAEDIVDERRAIWSGLLKGGASCAPKMRLWPEPGRSMR